MSTTFSDFFSKFANVWASFGIKDFLDICLVAFIIYNAIKILRETRAFQLVKGLLVCGVVYVIINILNMQASTYIFNLLISNIIVVLAIIFQPEIRHTLESAGRGKFSLVSPFVTRNSVKKADMESINRMISEFTVSCREMSEKNTGSITVFERSTLLGEIINTGTVVDCAATRQMFTNIFFPNAPLHDGAAVVRGSRIYAAGCILPLTQKNNNVSKELGTRHRAAIGMSEVSDALVVVTSEETGLISAAYRGNLRRGIDPADLPDLLKRYLLSHEPHEDESVLSRIAKRMKGGSRK